jgi:hypothetical protein
VNQRISVMLFLASVAFWAGWMAHSLLETPELVVVHDAARPVDVTTDCAHQLAWAMMGQYMPDVERIMSEGIESTKDRKIAEAACGLVYLEYQRKHQ